MNKLLMVFTLFGVLAISGCTKDTGCKPVPVDNEKTVIENYNLSIGMNATRHVTGLYYEIINPGSSTYPAQTSRVYVKYVGKTFDGKVFDSQTNPAVTGWALNSLIEGWKIGIPLVGKGGRVLLTIPSALAYGCQGAGENIPPNSPLHFEIDLVEFL